MTRYGVLDSLAWPAAAQEGGLADRRHELGHWPLAGVDAWFWQATASVAAIYVLDAAVAKLIAYLGSCRRCT